MTDTQQLLARLAQLDCAAICDADKTIRVMDYGIRPISKRPKMVGIAHTVRCRDDFLSVIKGLEESVPGEVLVVDAGGSPTAVVGELFATEARNAIAWFSGGVHVFDLRDPFHPKDIAWFIPDINQNTQPSCATRNGVKSCHTVVGTNNAATDDRGFVYIVDRWGSGTHMLELTGKAREQLFAIQSAK